MLSHQIRLFWVLVQQPLHLSGRVRHDSFPEVWQGNPLTLFAVLYQIPA